MTNAQIITEYKISKKMDLSEPLYTYQEWKRMGYQVKKGETSKHKVPVWKYTSKVVKDEDGNVKFDTYTQKEERVGKCYMRVAAFFTRDQVERIEEKVDE